MSLVIFHNLQFAHFFLLLSYILTDFQSCSDKPDVGLQLPGSIFTPASFPLFYRFLAHWTLGQDNSTKVNKWFEELSAIWSKTFRILTFNIFVLRSG